MHAVREMWVSLVEKAYAKFYSSYETIVSGQIHVALVDLTGGVGEQLSVSSRLQCSSSFLSDCQPCVCVCVRACVRVGV